MAKSSAAARMAKAAADMVGAMEEPESLAETPVASPVSTLGEEAAQAESPQREYYARLDRENKDREWARLGGIKLERSQCNVDYVLKHFGPGKYRVHEYGPHGPSGKVSPLRRWDMLVEDPNPAAPALVAPTVLPVTDLNISLHQQMLEQSRQSAAQMASIIAQSQSSHAAMLALLVKPDTGTNWEKVAAIVTAAAPIIAALIPQRTVTDPAETAAKLLAVLRESAPPRENAKADFLDMLKMAQQMAAGRPVGDDDEDDDGAGDWKSIMKSTIPAITSLAQAAMQRTPAPASAPVPTTAPVPAQLTAGAPEPPDAALLGLPLLDALVPILGRVAVTKAPGSHRLMGEWMRTRLAPEQVGQMQQAVADPNVVAMLGERYPVVRENRPWFQALVADVARRGA